METLNQKRMLEIILLIPNASIQTHCWAVNKKTGSQAQGEGVKYLNIPD